MELSARVEEMRNTQCINKCFQEKAVGVREKFLEMVTAELSPAEWLEERESEYFKQSEMVACRNRHLALITRVQGVNWVRRKC